MTEPRPTYTALPDPLTPEQLEALFSAIRSVDDYGSVKLIFERGALRVIEVSRSISVARLMWSQTENTPK